VYARALELLGQLRAAGTVPAIRAALYRGAWWAPRRTAALRRSAAAALARAGTAEALAALEEAAHHGSRGVRAAAQAELDLLSRDRTRGLS
jgi:HEAT repeat protein